MIKSSTIIDNSVLTSHQKFGSIAFHGLNLVLIETTHLLLTSTPVVLIILFPTSSLLLSKFVAYSDRLMMWFIGDDSEFVSKDSWINNSIYS